MPGIGATVMMIALFGTLIDQDPMVLLVFYASMINASQYAGSISAFYFGIPGESNSLPILSLRKALLEKGEIRKAIGLTAIGSTVAASIAVIISVMFLKNITDIGVYLRSITLAILGIIGITLSVATSSNKIFISIGLVIAGWCLGKIGFDNRTSQDFMTFGNEYLKGGIPSITVMLGIFALPVFMSSIKVSFVQPKFLDERPLSLMEVIRQLPVMLRSSGIGFIAGLIPYIGITISSNIAYYFEKLLRPRDHLSQAVAAESANNSATISVLIPLLSMGIAIQASEAVLLDLINHSNRAFNWNTIDLAALSLLLLVSNLIALSISWPLASKVSSLVSKSVKYLPYLMFASCAYTVYAVGQSYSQPLYYMVCLVVMLVIGMLLRKLDTLPLIFAFLLQDSVEPAILRTLFIAKHWGWL